MNEDKLRQWLKKAQAAHKHILEDARTTLDDAIVAGEWLNKCFDAVAAVREKDKKAQTWEQWLGERWPELSSRRDQMYRRLADNKARVEELADEVVGLGIAAADAALRKRTKKGDDEGKKKKAKAQRLRLNESELRLACEALDMDFDNFIEVLQDVARVQVVFTTEGEDEKWLASAQEGPRP